MLKNRISDEVVATERRGCTFEDIRPLVAGARGKAALEAGEPQNGIVTAGVVVGLIDDIPTCAELIERMVAECRERLEKGLSCFN